MVGDQYLGTEVSQHVGWLMEVPNKVSAKLEIELNIMKMCIYQAISLQSVVLFNVIGC